VLVLYNERLSIPATRTTEQGLMTALLRGQPEGLEIFSEYLDLVRFPGGSVWGRSRALSARKVRGAKTGRRYRDREFAGTGACTPRRTLCGRADCPNNQQKNRKAMKHIFAGFNLIGAIALLALTVGCAKYAAHREPALGCELQNRHR
jgi:hypothetical protein